MIFMLQMRKFFVGLLQRMQWQVVFAVVVFYGASSWLLLYWAGEEDIINNDVFFYWLIVTGSTVGYGDYSPTTVLGKWVVALWVLPLGLSIFGLAAGRIITFVSQQWRKGLMGLKTLHIENHILVIGWNGSSTLGLLNLLLREERFGEGRRIVLCSNNDIENPMPGDIDFVKVNSYSHEEAMQRTALMKASCIIIDAPDDHTTMASALFCNNYNPDVHTIVYFDDDSLYSLLKKHCPQIECAPSVATEMLAKAAVDPGSSMLHHELLNVDDGMTQYSVVYPEDQPKIAVERLFMRFKTDYEATIIGVKQPREQRLCLNPALDLDIEPGATVFYIADERLTVLPW